MDELSSASDALTRQPWRLPWFEDRILSSHGSRASVASLMDEYGLTKLELKTYLGLLTYGSSTAKELSKELGMSRVEVYRVLNRLLKRGIATSTLSAPRVYQPVRPSTAIRILLQEFESRARRMKESAPQLVLELETLERTERIKPEPPGGGYRVITGREQVDTLREMFHRSRSMIQGVWPLQRMQEVHLIVPFVQCVRDGVRAQLICDLTRKNIEEVKEMLRVATIRHHQGAERGFRFTIVDGREMIFAVSTVDMSLSSSVAIWSDNHSLIQDMTTTFQMLWNASTPVEERLSELSQEKLRRVSSTDKQEA